MNTPDFFSTRAQFNKVCEDILGIKGESYAREDINDDRLGNFKRTAAYIGCDPLQVAFVFFMKHVDSISKWVVQASAGEEPTDAGGEPVIGRFADARNYIDIMEAIASERGLIT